MDPTQYSIAKLIQIEAKLAAIGTAVSILLEQTLPATTRKKPKGQKVPPAGRKLILASLGPAAAPFYEAGEIAHFADLFPEEARNVQEFLEMSSKTESQALVDAVSKEINAQPSPNS